MRGILATFLIAGAWFLRAGAATDWPQFLGPDRNGVYPGTDVAATWPAGGPPVVWRRPAGHGFSGPAVAAGRLILFHRRDAEEVVECVEAGSGKLLWSAASPTSYEDDFGFDDGPRATPAITGGQVFTFGAEGRLQCLELATGRRVWGVDLGPELHAAKGFFGLACSPLVEGHAVLVNAGGKPGAGITAFDTATGKLLWKATDDEASYSSPVAATLAGRRCALFLTRAGFVAIDPESGAVRYRYPWRSRSSTSVNAATPLVLGDTIFLSACYGTGAAVLKVGAGGIEKVWSGDDLLSNHYSTSVARKGSLYGIHGRTDPGYQPKAHLRCVDPFEHKVRWETDTVGAATVTLAGDRLIILTEPGDLVNAAASPDHFEASARFPILTTQTRAFPAIANGLLYARDKQEWICVDLRDTKAK